jgi:hypothetical protein
MAIFSMTSAPASFARPQRRLARALTRAYVHAAAWVRSVQEGYAAAALYDELRSLSACELKRRGIADGDLIRHIRDQLGR